MDEYKDSDGEGIYHIAATKKGWKIWKEGAIRPCAHVATKEMAVKIGKVIGQRMEIKLIIHDGQGNVRLMTT
ncbi:MAG TPA: DUF2188 domain-containing protein [Bacillota bacterium]|nr:DUF2188 domain-containing protein [Bacillota bacterium]